MLSPTIVPGTAVVSNTKLYPLSPLAPEYEAGTKGFVENVFDRGHAVLFEIRIGDRVITGVRLGEQFDPVS